MPGNFNDIVEDKVQKAINEGAFKDLSGKGKPLNFEAFGRNNSEDWLSNKILRSLITFLRGWLKNIKKGGGV